MIHTLITCRPWLDSSDVMACWHFIAIISLASFFPPDVKMASVSRTVGESQMVEELAISFTHTTAIDWLLPSVSPRGKPVEMAVAVVVGFKDGKISHEHIYWDQASVLVQVGL